MEKIAALLWRKRRLEGAETDVIHAVQAKPATENELQAELGLTSEHVPAWMFERDETFDFRVIKPIPSLPNWMLDEKMVPTEAEGKEAMYLCDEWNVAQMAGIHAEREAEAAHHFPRHWKRLQAAMAGSRDGDNAAFYLQIRFRQRDFDQNFEAFMLQQQKSAYWLAYWHQNRDRMAAAFRAIRVKRMLAAWDLERSHRYHTMLDNQLFRLLREFREMRAWRLSSLEMTHGVEEQPSEQSSDLH